MLSFIFIVLIIAITGLKIYLNNRQANSINSSIKQVPAPFDQNITLEEHQKAAKYNLKKISFGNLEIVVSAVVTLLFTLGGGIQLINNYLLEFTSYPISQGVLIIGIFTLINAVLDLPFSWYKTFSIEQKFGFNKMTKRLFIFDLFKGILLAIIIGVPLLYAILWLMTNMGSLWWLWVFAVLVGFNLLILVLYPTVIAPLFNKFTPLEDIELKTRIETLLKKCGFKSQGVFIMDGSKRSSHGNAYFTGLGKSKRIVFFDTLIKQLNHDEIEAVLAHELGHFKHKHIVKQMLVSFTITLVTLFGLSLLLDSTLFYNALGITSINHANALLLFSIVLGLISFPFAPLSSYFSRKNEFEADDFAKQNSNKDWLISGLVKMYRDNASTLTPDELYVKFYYSHPPANVRIANLEKTKNV